MSTELSNVAESLILTDQEGSRSGYTGAAATVTAPLSQTGEVVRRWHNDVHAGAFSTCSEQPCDAVRRVE